MATKKNTTKGSGFLAPTIGTQVPAGYVYKKGKDGKMKLVKVKK